MNNKIFISINSTYFFRFAGLNFDGILERLFNKGNNTSTLIARPKVLTFFSKTLISFWPENFCFLWFSFKM